MADTKITDPLGRVIVLHDRTWYGHIVRGHPEVAQSRKCVETAVQDPIEIRKSLSDPNCRLFYGAGGRKDVIIMVVVDVAQGLVKTAHFAEKISKGEVEWSKPTP